MQQTIHRKRDRRGQNLTYADRVRGGKHSAAMQRRDERGKFAGKRREEEELTEEQREMAQPVETAEETTEEERT